MATFVQMEKSFTHIAIAQLQDVVSKLIPLFDKCKVVLFYGHMGAGKTTLINAVCRQLGVVGHTGSPTFSIVNEYRTLDGATIYHFDFYRLKSEVEAYDLGSEDYLYSGNVCLIEWPEKIASLLPEEVIEVHISGMGEYRDIKIIG